MSMDVKTNVRKWSALLIAIIIYFAIHEGAHLIYSLAIGTFKQINFIGLGIQVDVYKDSITDIQLSILCIIGPVTTVVFGYLLIGFTKRFLQIKSVWLRAITYYVTLAFLIIDPLYLTAVYSLVGGGDMNGISLLLPELYVRIVSGIVLLINLFIIYKYIIPEYSKAYRKSKTS